MTLEIVERKKLQTNRRGRKAPLIFLHLYHWKVEQKITNVFEGTNPVDNRWKWDRTLRRRHDGKDDSWKNKTRGKKEETKKVLRISSSKDSFLVVSCSCNWEECKFTRRWQNWRTWKREKTFKSSGIVWQVKWKETCLPWEEEDDRKWLWANLLCVWVSMYFFYSSLSFALFATSFLMDIALSISKEKGKSCLRLEGLFFFLDRVNLSGPPPDLSVLLFFPFTSL